MNASTPSDTVSPLRMFETPGMLIFFVVIFGSLYLAHHFQEAVMQRFGLHGGSPSDEPPWYFITRDFAEGVCSAGAFLLCVLVAVVMWRWWPGYAAMLVWMSLLWLGQDVARSWIIHQACPGLLEGLRSTSRWPTHESYLHDHDIEWMNTGVMVGAVSLSVIF